MFNMLLWPEPRLASGPIMGSASALAAVCEAALSELQAVPMTLISIGRFALGLLAPGRPFRTGATRPDLSLTERTSSVSSITVAPYKLVGYLGDSVTFVAMGSDVRGQAVNGARFEWETSDDSKLSIDEAGRARLKRPGMVRVTARAGFVQKSAFILIRPTRRRPQTDLEWRADQDSLVADAGSPTETDRAGWLTSFIDRLAPTALAQSEQGADYGNAAPVVQVGKPPFTALEETRLGSVMPQTNFELPLPIVDLGGRGLSTRLTAFYNSNVWGTRSGPEGTTYVFDPIQSWPSPGFSLGFGRIVIYDYSNYDGIGSGYKYMLVEPDGTRHSLGIGSDTGNNVLQTTDGSHITYAGNALGGTVYYQDGTQMTIGLVNNRRLPTQITDTNGNYIQIAYKSETNFPAIAINYIIDTLGRVIQFNYGEWPAPPGSALLTSITTPVGAVTFNYQTITMDTNFLTPVAVENVPAVFSAISSVAVPDRPAYSFGYSGYGMMNNLSAVSSGGTATVTYNYPPGGQEIVGQPIFTQRAESPSAVYTYTSSDVTRPDGTKLSLSASLRELKNSSNQTLSKTEYAYTADPGGSTAVQSVVSTDEAGQQTKVDFDYDAYGNVVNKREYGFRISGQWQVRRRTHYSYINWEPYLSAYIRNRAWLVETFDALENTSDADDVLVGKTAYSYDTSMGGMEDYGGTANPPGHLSSYDTAKMTRGNVTGVTTYSDLGSGGVTHNSKTDIFGNTTKAQVSCCDEKSYTITEATYWSRASQVTNGSASGIHLTSSAAYDFNTLAVISEMDPNNQVVTYSYDTAARPTGFTFPTGASGASTYNAWGEITSSSMTWNEGGTNKTITETAIYDGWGQMTSSVDSDGSQTNFTYDNMGKLITRTNPFPQGGTLGAVTTYVYDLLGRNISVTQPGGGTVQTSYASSTVMTVIDQVNRRIKRESDSLGRLIKVTEQDVSSGSLIQETNYTYDIADQLTQVDQGNQIRTLKHDAEGRLLYERIPEMTATINDGSGTYWTTKYTYADWGAVATKQDARGVITTYGYDTLHRLISVNYNTSGAPGVASTPSVSYNYDNNQSSGTKGLLLSLSVGSGYAENYSYDSLKRLQSMTCTMDGRSYTTSYQFDTANQITRMTYPSGRVINIGHDGKGRVTSIGSYLSSVTFNGIGQMTGTTLGNGVTEGYGYDANRMQLISQTATKNGGPANGLMNLAYGYDAAAGQMGAGSTAGNPGQLISISGTINQTTESAAYSYDNIGRVVTSNQTSNGSSAQRRFAYDRWGNRTAMWDAVSGGSQIQSIALQQSGGAPTNRITNLTSGSSSVNYAYDSAGNMTSDGVHSYTYDAENRIVNVDGGSTASYAYDQSNQRYKKVTGGTTTHYVWQGSQVIAEHNAGTGASIADYVYFGSRMIAKIAGLSTQYFLNDRLSTRLVLNTGGNVIGRQAHLPFGEDFGETGVQDKHHFTSYERDSESGTDYALNRSYSPAVGRFQTVDPFKPSGNLENPQSWNRYSYVGNDSINAIDPSGLVQCFLLMDDEGFPLKGTNGMPVIACLLDQVIAIVQRRGRGTRPTAKACRKGLHDLQAAAADRLGTAVTKANELSGRAGAEIAGEFNNGITFFQNPDRFPFSGFDSNGNPRTVYANAAARFFIKLGKRASEKFETRGGRQGAKALARDGLNALDGLYDSASSLLDSCLGVRGLSRDEITAMKDLRDATQFGEVAYGAFFQGVLNGFSGSVA